jgi:hypothetical protein
VSRKRLHHDDDEQWVETAPTARSTDRDPDLAEPAAALLDLQARAGNAAVGDLIAGDGPAALQGVVQRQPAPGKTGQAGDTEEAEESGGERTRAVALLTIPELAAPVRLQSFSARSRESGGEGRGRALEHASVQLTVAISDFDVALSKASMNGTVYASAVVSMTGVRYLMKDVIVAGVSYAPEIVSVTLDVDRLSVAT